MRSLVLALLATTLYAFASHQLAGHAQAPNPAPRRWLWLALPAVALHAAVHGWAWQQMGAADLHFFPALSLVGLGMAALTTALGPAQRIEALGIIVFPLAALVLLAYALLGGSFARAGLDWRLQLHALMALLEDRRTEGYFCGTWRDGIEAAELAERGVPVSMMAVSWSSCTRKLAARPGRR